MFTVQLTKEAREILNSAIWPKGPYEQQIVDLVFSDLIELGLVRIVAIADGRSVIYLTDTGLSERMR